MIALPELAPARPPCSAAERAGAEALAQSLQGLGVSVRVDTLRAPTSPTWIPLLRALLRVWAVAFIAGYRPIPAVALASLSILAGLRSLSALVRFVPLLGDVTQNVVARIDGRDASTKPIIMAAHIDTHPTAAAPMGRAHAAAGALLGWLALATGLVGRPGLATWRVAAAMVAAEAIVTLTWLARRELTVMRSMPDDNTSGLLALLSAAKLLCSQLPLHDVWLVGTGAGTSGGHGMTAFLRTRRELREAWVVEADALGAGEVVVCPFPARFPRPGTPVALVRAVVAAARETGDPLSVRRARRQHSDARTALSRRVGAVTLTAGLGPPAGHSVPDAANAERAARVVDRLARSA